jgi:hypothetical protein
MILLFILGCAWVVVGKITMETGASRQSATMQKMGVSFIVLGSICLLSWVALETL